MGRTSLLAVAAATCPIASFAQVEAPPGDRIRRQVPRAERGLIQETSDLWYGVRTQFRMQARCVGTSSISQSGWHTTQVMLRVRRAHAVHAGSRPKWSRRS
jgi:hypothetical protein